MTKRPEEELENFVSRAAVSGGGHTYLRGRQGNERHSMMEEEEGRGQVIRVSHLNNAEFSTFVFGSFFLFADLSFTGVPAASTSSVAVYSEKTAGAGAVGRLCGRSLHKDSRLRAL